MCANYGSESTIGNMDDADLCDQQLEICNKSFKQRVRETGSYRVKWRKKKSMMELKMIDENRVKKPET